MKYIECMYTSLILIQDQQEQQQTECMCKNVGREEINTFSCDPWKN